MDEAKEESVVNLTGGNRGGVLALANGCLLAGGWLLHAGSKAAVRARCLPVHLSHFREFDALDRATVCCSTLGSVPLPEMNVPLGPGPQHGSLMAVLGAGHEAVIEA